MTDLTSFEPVFQDAAQRYQLDPALLRAQALVESGMNPNASNQESGATGLMQVIPDTAKSLGIDPTDPRQSIYGAAALMRQNLDRYMGDVEKAVSAYHGGTDPSNWGPKTQAYVGKVADAFGAMKQNNGFLPGSQPAGDSPDPIETALSGAKQPPQAADPVEAALMGQPTPGEMASSAGPAAPAVAAPAAQPGSMDDLNTTQLLEPTLGTPGRDFINAAAHHMAKLPVGVAQLAANALLPAGAAGAVNNAVAAEEKAYQDQTPDSPSSYAGAALGEIAPFALTSLGRGLQIAGDAVGAAPRWLASKLPGIGGAVAPTVGKGVSAAAQGAIVAGARPADQPLSVGGPSFWDQKVGDVEQGAALGTAAQGAASLLGAAANIVRPLAAPGSVVSDWVRRAAGSDASQIAQALRAAPEYVPGSVPTTAQIWNSPDLALAEKTLVSGPETKGAWMARNAENNAARWDALNNLAGTPADLDAAVAAHKAAVAPAISSILENGNPVNVQPILDAINATQKGSLGTDPVVAKGLSDLKQSIVARLPQPHVHPAGFDAYGMPLPQPQVQPPEPVISPDILDGIRQNARKFLVDNASNGAVSSKQEAALGPIKDAITGAIEDANPGYRDYLRTFAETRQPVTDRELAQGVVDTLGGRGLTVGTASQIGGQPQITLPGMNAALRPAEKAQYGFSPQAQSVVDGILQDLQRSTGGANAVRASGSDTVTNAMLPGWLGQALYGKNLGGGALNLPYIKPLGEFAGKRVRAALADAMLNPSTMADYLAPTNPGRLGPLAQALAARAPQLVAPFPLAQQLTASRP